MLVVGDLRALWRIATLPAAPANRLAFKPRRNVRPGSKVYSEFVAPDFFPAGSLVKVSGDGEPQIVTRTGRHRQPVAVAPGDPLQIVIDAPEGPGQQREIKIELGGRSTIWRVATAG